MADGTFIDGPRPTDPTGSIAAVSNALMLLIDTATGADNGQWMPFTPFSRMAMEVTGTATFSFQLCGSNSPSIPANSNHGSSLGSAVTSTGMTQLTYTPRWIKAHVTACTGGNLTVTLNAVGP